MSHDKHTPQERAQDRREAEYAASRAGMRLVNEHAWTDEALEALKAENTSLRVRLERVRTMEREWTKRLAENERVAEGIWDKQNGAYADGIVGSLRRCLTELRALLDPSPSEASR